MIYHITNRTLGRAIHGAVIPTLSVVIFNIHSCLEGEVVGGVLIIIIIIIIHTRICQPYRPSGGRSCGAAG